MSGIELKPCGGTDESQTNILMPLGKSTVGRGSLLGIADKRVSRNHGMIEVEDGIIKIMPTHSNPTFYQPKGGAKLAPIKKDAWQTLQHGDKIGLTPDQHIFEIIMHDRPLNHSTQSQESQEENSSPQKPPLNTEKTEEAVKKPEGQQNGDDKIADDEEKPTVKESEKKEEQKGDESKPDADKKSTKPEEDKDERDEEEDDEDTKDTNGDADPDKENVETVKLEDGKEVALPTQKERTLPNWMDKADTGKAAKDEEEPEDAVAEKPAKKKDGRGRPKGYSPKAKGKKGRGRPPKRAADDDDREPISPSRKVPIREKRKKYSDDDYEEEPEEEEDEPKTVMKDDDDWVLSFSDEVESEISDWESSQGTKKAKSKKKTPSKKRGRKAAPKKPAKPRKEPTRRQSSRAAKENKKSYATDSEEEFLYDDEIYVPKPTKRMAARTPRKSYRDDSDDSDSFSPAKSPSPKKKGRGRGRPPAKKKKTTEKKPCKYGADCYRKNPGHFKDFCHPGDPEYPDSGDEADKEECPYGAECYRTNKPHLKQYRHLPPQPSSRPKREAAQKKAVVIQGDRSSLLHSGVSDDDGAPNTYDDNDSFLDDAIMGSDEEDSKAKRKAGSDDSDWDPTATDEVKA